MKKSKTVEEFKKFITKGNVADMAVGIIVGGAFQKIVTSFVNDLVMPIVGLFTGGVNFNDQFAILKLPEGVDAAQVTSLEVAKELGVTTLNYGSFITIVLDFLILALTVFFLVKGINKVKENAEKLKKEEEAAAAPAAPTTKKCPYCCTEIAIEATRCPHCTSELDK
ncbi:MAG: large conductance mechanosensitive channel protein MscL [Ruminococcaceae bacterium]|nr:large conductance mechanosensitive channel protein MscL [Oscillospiraceae bacterium]